MYTGLQHLHSGIAYLAILALIIVIILMLIGALSGREFTEKDRKIAMIAFIFSHIQLLIGLILYFVSPIGFQLLISGGAMSDSTARLTALEHPLINIIAIVLISIGYIRAKKLTLSKSKFRSIYMMYAIGLVLILSRIPWASWLGN
jgi:predicted acyltransferase